MGKNKHRQASTPESKKQAAIWCAIAIIAITVMVLAANPWKQQTSTTSTPQSSQSTQTRSHKQNKKKKTTKPSGTLQQQAQSMFTGDAEQIADDVRDLLNAPENSNVDTLGNLLYRHNRQDLAEATDLYDAIGQQKDIDTIRSLAREWYPQAMQAGIETRRPLVRIGQHRARGRHHRTGRSFRHARLRRSQSRVRDRETTRGLQVG